MGNLIFFVFQEVWVTDFCASVVGGGGREES